MDSTPTPKASEPDDALTARPDERLAHAYEQITRADEKLAQLSEQVERWSAMRRRATSSVERPPRFEHPPSTERSPAAESGSASPPRTPAFRAFVGLALAACIHRRFAGFTVVLWRKSQAGGRPLGAAAHFSSIASGKCAGSPHSRPHPLFNWLPPIQPCRKQRRGAGRTTRATKRATSSRATKRAASGRVTKRAAGSRATKRTTSSRASGFRPNPIAASDDAQPGGTGPNRRTAQGEPATNGRGQCKSH